MKYGKLLPPHLKSANKLWQATNMQMDVDSGIERMKKSAKDAEWRWRIREVSNNQKDFAMFFCDHIHSNQQNVVYIERVYGDKEFSYWGVSIRNWLS